MLTTGLILIIAIIVLVIMMVGIMAAVLAIVIEYSGKGATYDRAGNKMAKARAGKSPKKKKAKPAKVKAK